MRYGKTMMHTGAAALMTVMLAAAAPAPAAIAVPEETSGGAALPEEPHRVSISKKEVPTVRDTGVGAKPLTNGVTIYVSKMQNTVILKQNGREIGVYPASLGSNSRAGDKQGQGDRRTPSGNFYICTMNDQSAYHLGLGLSYPDIADAKRGLEEGIITQEEHDSIVDAIKKGQKPPWDTALGGAIEIHGMRYEGGGTAGCIAVDNEVMDILWQYSMIGVPVTVGP